MTAKFTTVPTIGILKGLSGAKAPGTHSNAVTVTLGVCVAALLLSVTVSGAGLLVKHHPPLANLRFTQPLFSQDCPAYVERTQAYQRVLALKFTSAVDGLSICDRRP